MSRGATLILALLLLAGLSACGKRGDPIPPEGATYPQRYPDPRYVLPESARTPPPVEAEPRSQGPSIFPYSRKTTKTYEPVSPAGTPE